MLKTLGILVSVAGLSVALWTALPAPATANVAGAASCGAQANAAPSQSSAAGIAQAVLCLINAERARAGVQPATLARVTQLDAAAQGHASAAASIRWWRAGADSHRNPQTGSTIQSRIAASGYCSGRPMRFTEITYTGYGSGATPVAAVNWWVNVSTFGHRGLVLDPQVNQIGIGIAGPSADPGAGTNPQQGTYVVNFGGCASAAPGGSGSPGTEGGTTGPMSQSSVTLCRPIDVYSAPQHEGGTLVGRMNTDDWARMDGCQGDWCRISGPQVPGTGNVGWVWSGRDYDALCRYGPP